MSLLPTISTTIHFQHCYLFPPVLVKNMGQWSNKYTATVKPHKTSHTQNTHFFHWYLFDCPKKNTQKPRLFIVFFTSSNWWWWNLSGRAGTKAPRPTAFWASKAHAKASSCGGSGSLRVETDPKKIQLAFFVVILRFFFQENVVFFVWFFLKALETSQLLFRGGWNEKVHIVLYNECHLAEVFWKILACCQPEQ